MQPSIPWPLVVHSVTIPEEWHRSFMGIFQCYISFQMKDREWKSEKTKKVRETDTMVYHGADRGSDRCSGPEEARTCDWWSQAPHENTPSLKKAGLPWLQGEVITEEDWSQAYLWKIISFDTVSVENAWLHTLAEVVQCLYFLNCTFVLVCRIEHLII